MNEPSDIIRRIRQSAAKRILFLPHAIRQMSSPDRMIRTGDIRALIANGELIEDYPQDPRGHSCLLLHVVDDRPLHVVCSPKDDYLAIITAYIPNDQEWESGYRKRKQK